MYWQHRLLIILHHCTIALHHGFPLQQCWTWPGMDMLIRKKDLWTMPRYYFWLAVCCVLTVKCLVFENASIPIAATNFTTISPARLSTIVRSPSNRVESFSVEVGEVVAALVSSLLPAFRVVLSRIFFGMTTITIPRVTLFGWWNHHYHYLSHIVWLVEPPIPKRCIGILTHLARELLQHCQVTWVSAGSRRDAHQPRHIAQLSAAFHISLIVI